LEGEGEKEPVGRRIREEGWKKEKEILTR